MKKIGIFFLLLLVVQSVEAMDDNQKCILVARYIHHYPEGRNAEEKEKIKSFFCSRQSIFSKKDEYLEISLLVDTLLPAEIKKNIFLNTWNLKVSGIRSQKKSDRDWCWQKELDEFYDVKKIQNPTFINTSLSVCEFFKKMESEFCYKSGKFAVVEKYSHWPKASASSCLIELSPDAASQCTVEQLHYIQELMEGVSSNESGVREFTESDLLQWQELPQDAKKCLKNLSINIDTEHQWGTTRLLFGFSITNFWLVSNFFADLPRVIVGSFGINAGVAKVLCFVLNVCTSYLTGHYIFPRVDSLCNPKAIKLKKFFGNNLKTLTFGKGFAMSSAIPSLIMFYLSHLFNSSGLASELDLVMTREGLDHQYNLTKSFFKHVAFCSFSLLSYLSFVDHLRWEENAWRGIPTQQLNNVKKITHCYSAEYLE